MTLPRRNLSKGAFFALLSLASGAVASAEAFPSKTVRIVVPFAAGGSLDTLTRAIADQLQARWERTVIVENRVGASGNLGSDFVARADADGHTLLASPPPLAINQFLFKAATSKPSDFAFISILTTAPNVLIAHPRVGATSVQQLVEKAKASPGKLSYASTGRGGTPHLTMEWFKLRTGVDFTHVPYPKGFAPALTDLLGGHVDLMFANISDASALIRDGRVKAIGVASETQIDELKSVHPISLDVPGFVSEAWFALAAPRGTPRAVVEKIASDVGATLETPSVAHQLRALSLTRSAKGPVEAEQFVEQEVVRWKKVIEVIGLQPE